MIIMLKMEKKSWLKAYLNLLKIIIVKFAILLAFLTNQVLDLTKKHVKKNKTNKALHLKSRLLFKDYKRKRPALKIIFNLKKLIKKSKLTIQSMKEKKMIIHLK
jgi:hypothetical protein